MNEQLTLEERISRIEKKLNEKKVTNEVAPIIAKAVPMIVKNLPLILNMIPEIVAVLESDQLNDNSDKVELLNQFSEIAQKVSEMFSNIKV